ncbi:MAG: response regulator [Polyangiaceae bacterium]|nr:response regulator [Polyangiaceae bacterium]
MATTKPLRIVVIDDDDDSREMMAVLLESLGHRVECTRDGVAGLALIQETPPDLAIIDLELPTVSGCEIVQRLRTAGIATFCAALTGDARPSTRMAAFKAGFHAHLVKPVEFSDLVMLLDSVGVAERAAQPTGQASGEAVRSSRPD